MRQKVFVKKILLIGIIIVALSFSILPAFGSDSVSHKIIVKIPVIQAMSIETRNATSSGEEVVTRYEVPNPSDEDLARGYVENEDVATLAVTSNVDWKVTVRAKNRYLGTSYDGTYKKLVSDLLVRCIGGYEPVTTHSKVIVEKEPGIFNLDLDYKTKFHRQEYKPGPYDATLVYTISSRA